MVTIMQAAFRPKLYRLQTSQRGEIPAMTHAYVELPSSVCRDFEQSGKLEWWLSNGIGGYAGGTVSGVLTRRYHGLLCVPLDGPLGRRLLFAKADATLLHDGREYPLHANQWNRGEIDPQGYSRIEHFYLDGDIPVWRFRAGEFLIEQRIWMPHGKNQTCMAFRLINFAALKQEPPQLRLALIASYRDHHEVNNINDFQLSTRIIENGMQLSYPQADKLYLYSDKGHFSKDNTWVENFFLQEEQLRGLESVDHHLRIGHLEIPLSGDWRGLVISSGKVGNINLAYSMTEEYHRIAEILEEAFPGLRLVSKPAWVFQLVVAADSFLFKRMRHESTSGESVIAGFPWVGDWGRDTMIALPGLCLATGRYNDAWQILKTFAEFVDEGMVPNNFPGNGETPQYNSVDASLWYIEAWRAYLHSSGDLDSVNEVLPLLEEILYAYRDGTRYAIAMDSDDGLLQAGEVGQQLTWMDARVDDREVTPRHGKPVEVNALWYNAIMSMIHFYKKLGLPADEFEQLAELTRKGFERFVRGDGQGLYDVLDGPAGHDSSIRPNQIIALSLHYSPLQSTAVMQSILQTCRQHLLTPCGLRTLSANDENYIGCYEGGIAQRDASYHQGTVWAWLLGHYALAQHRVTDDPAAAQELLEGLHSHLTQDGMGQINEIFDGDAPHQPRGAPAQAWSVACTLEAWWKLERAKLAKELEKNT